MIRAIGDVRSFGLSHVTHLSQSARSRAQGLLAAGNIEPTTQLLAPTMGASRVQIPTQKGLFQLSDCLPQFRTMVVVQRQLGGTTKEAPR